MIRKFLIFCILAGTQKMSFLLKPFQEKKKLQSSYLYKLTEKTPFLHPTLSIYIGKKGTVTQKFENELKPLLHLPNFFHKILALISPM